MNYPNIKGLEQLAEALRFIARRMARMDYKEAAEDAAVVMQRLESLLRISGLSWGVGEELVLGESRDPRTGEYDLVSEFVRGKHRKLAKNDSRTLATLEDILRITKGKTKAEFERADFAMLPAIPALYECADAYDAARAYWRRQDAQRSWVIDSPRARRAAVPASKDESHKCHEWSDPLKKTDLVRRYFGKYDKSLRSRQLESFFTENRIRRVGKQNLWEICLDDIDDATRKKLRTELPDP